MTDNHNHPKFDRTQPRAPSWFRLNGLGVLVGLLELFIGLYYFAGVGVERGDIVATAAHAGIGTAGAGLLYSYARRRVDVEVYASVLMVVANLLAFTAKVYSQTPAAFELRSATTQAIIIVAVALRVSALLQGGTIVIPRWRR